MMQYRKLVLLALLTISLMAAKAQNKPGNAILGQWWDEDKIAKIEIYKQGNKYFGKLVWGNTMFDKNGKSNKDVKNPDDKLKKRDLYNLVMLTDFVYEDGEWTDGRI